MTLAEYLASPQARENVRAAIGALAANYRVTLPALGAEMRTFPDGAWSKVEIVQVLSDERLRAYYRPDGEFFVVSDLGEGVKAYRLRTGEVQTEHGRNWFNGRVMCNHGVIEPARSPVAVEDLPDAICRVMLASHRIATMEA